MLWCVLIERISTHMTIGKINSKQSLASVEKLLPEDKSASPQVRAMMELLVVVINLLLVKLGLNSKNSSIPPSKDPKRERGSTRKGKGEKRKSGGQNGHKGSTIKKKNVHFQNQKPLKASEAESPDQNRETCWSVFANLKQKPWGLWLKRLCHLPTILAKMIFAWRRFSKKFQAVFAHSMALKYFAECVAIFRHVGRMVFRQLKPCKSYFPVVFRIFL